MLHLLISPIKNQGKDRTRFLYYAMAVEDVLENLDGIDFMTGQHYGCVHHEERDEVV